MEDTEKIVADADKAFGRVDILVNSAGITDRGTIWDTEPELFDAMFAVNVRAPFFLMQHALKVMKREKIEGSIVNIISMSGHGGQSFITAYCASKGALITLTKNVAYSRHEPPHPRQRPDHRLDGYAGHPTFFGLGLHSCVNVPLVGAGKCLGTLNVLNARSMWSDDEVAAARVLGLAALAVLMLTR